MLSNSTRRTRAAAPAFEEGVARFTTHDRSLICVLWQTKWPLAPLYDFGPAFLDARAIARTIRWEGEQPGRLDWNAILDSLETRFEKANLVLPPRKRIVETMRAFAADLARLPALMQECGVDDQIVAMRREEITRLAQTLEEIR